ncbi:MAG: hypothetical protein U0401_33085 [Anaerolineae bacterium]
MRILHSGSPISAGVHRRTELYTHWLTQRLFSPTRTPQIRFTPQRSGAGLESRTDEYGSQIWAAQAEDVTLTGVLRLLLASGRCSKLLPRCWARLSPI